MLKFMDERLPERFWDKVSVEPNTGCWLWLAQIDKDGYGKFKLNSRTLVAAHRVSYGGLVAPIPDGCFVCHKCDNPPCVNPDHLFVGTVKDNVRDMFSKGRGKRNPPTKITATDAASIRKDFAGGAMKADLTNQFGISRAHLNGILAGRKWSIEI